MRGAFGLFGLSLSGCFQLFALSFIEVKAGGTGRMQSMRMFMKERNIGRGIRTSLENFGTIDGIDIVPLYALASHLMHV